MRFEGPGIVRFRLGGRRGARPGVAAGGSGLADVRNDSSVVSPILHTLYKLPGGAGDQLRMALTRAFKTPDPARLIARLP
ncbi:hypothetical protein F2P44_10210 [Massilia sp. CCM 8695]|uniref:Uncharacterized protein n=1 Tax=Massilia frigida TaxID=2609281 RepID=A0ABX0N5G0_9BURK|nr:hypothetical protein [Massilia frigida]NHZ79648.1 hypothetical protein [Massilia frigida]